MVDAPDVRLTTDQIDALREAAYADRFDEVLQQRNDAIVTVLYDAGVSPRTLVRLDTDAVSPDRTELTLPSGDVDGRVAAGTDARPDGANDVRGTERRTIELDPTGRLGTRRLLASYLRNRWKDAEALFPSRKDDRLTVRAVRYVVERLADEAGIEPTTVDGVRGDPADVTPLTISLSGRERSDRGSAGPRPGRTDASPTASPDRPVGSRENDVLSGRRPVDDPVLDNLRDLFYVIDANGRFRRWNERVTEVTGYDDEELADVHAVEVIEPADRAEIADAMASVFDGNAETRETALLTSDGERIPYEFNGAPITDASGDVVGLTGVGRDITERKRRERELSRYETIVNAVGDGVYRLDESGNIVMVNDAATRVTGYDRDELIGEPVAKLLDDEDVSESVSVIRDLLRDDGAEVGHLEFDVHTADGETIPAHARIAVLQSDGEFRGTVGVVRDVSERKERMRELQRQRNELATLDRINAVIRRIDQTLVQATTKEEILRTVCTELADIDQYRFAWIGEYESTTGRVKPRSWAGVEEGYLDARPGVESRSSEDITAETAYRTGDIQVAQNIAENEAFASWRDAALERGYRSAVAIPLSYREVTYGVLCLYAPRPEAFDERESEVLSELGTTIAHAISAVRRREALVTDSIVELEFAVRDSDFLLADLSAGTGAELVLNGLVSYEEGPPTAFVTMTGAAPGDLLDAARRAGAAPEIVSEDDEQVLLRFETASLVPFEIAEYGGVVRDAVAEGGEARVTAEFPQSADVRTVADALRRNEFDVELLSRHDRERPATTGAEFRSELDDALTDRQREVLKTAYLSGFFDRPRRSSGEEIADALDVSPPTFHEHVRAGERKLFETYFDSP